MEGQEFLTEYRNISNKLKKRFLRRPNVSEASDQFRQLGKRLEDGDEAAETRGWWLVGGAGKGVNTILRNTIFREGAYWRPPL